MIKGLHVLAWEVTRRCPMACKHCRGASRNDSYQGELSTEEALKIIDSLHAAEAHPMIIFTGGEPMYREDLVTLVTHANTLGFPCVLAPCGRFATAERLQQLKDAGIRMLSISVDGPDASIHDTFRGVEGAFNFALDAMKAAHKVGLPFQINTTVSRKTLHSLRAMRDFAREQGALRVDYFFLVPVGRGSAIADQCLTAEEAELALKTLLDLDAEARLPIHVTCAPHIIRLLHQRAMPCRSRFNGCMAGAGFCFLSHTGKLQPCGFFDIDAGDVRQYGLDFAAAYQASEIFAKLREGPNQGSCGACAYRLSCRGCRARAYAATGDLLAPEPSCIRAKSVQE
ncbi:MAG: radical SAM protein [Kiritimatiellia bacterium]